MRFRRFMLGLFMTFTLIALEFAYMGMVLSGCTPLERAWPGDDIGVSEDDLSGYVPCHVSETRYPTVPVEFFQVYQGRRFYADGNHLGHDVALAEGTPVSPVGCGILRVYRPANGYGRLVVAVEHRLSKAVAFTNGLGEQVTTSQFITIYGHLRKSKDRAGLEGILGWMAGDKVGPQDVIGYVDDDAHNGDGVEHLHFGVRLQSALAASATDKAWFRGYDTVPSQRRWFSDPVLFMETFTAEGRSVFWHPAGTVVRGASGEDLWMLDSQGYRQQISPELAVAEGLASRAIVASEAELGCEALSTPYKSPREWHKVVKFSDASTVYEYEEPWQGTSRWAFVTYPAFLSWGWKDSDIAHWPAAKRDEILGHTIYQGLRTLRDGSLVKADEESEVSVVSDGLRLPIVDWPTFLALGYRAEQIVGVPKDVIEIVAGPKGPMITTDLLTLCVHPSLCLEDCPSPSEGGGEGFDDVPPGQVLFMYEGPVTGGAHEFQGMWDPSGPAFHDWVSETFALCPDTELDDHRLACLLDMPSGTANFLFTVRLPDGRWWGDKSCDPTGGCGDTLGTVTLLGPNGQIPYVFKNNGTGPEYWNGFVSLVP